MRGSDARRGCSTSFGDQKSQKKSNTTGKHVMPIADRKGIHAHCEATSDDRMGVGVRGLKETMDFPMEGHGVGGGGGAVRCAKGVDERSGSTSLVGAGTGGVGETPRMDPGGAGRCERKSVETSRAEY